MIDFTGKVCVCNIGRVGIVTGKKKLDWGESWVGFGLDGKGLWASSNPQVLAESLEDYAEMILKRPNQVMYPESSTTMKLKDISESLKDISDNIKTLVRNSGPW